MKTRGERLIWLTASVMAVMHKDNMDWNPEKLTFDIDVTKSRYSQGNLKVVRNWRLMIMRLICIVVWDEKWGKIKLIL